MEIKSHKLKSSFEGALAGGGDPASSPLYVFGPFLKLLVVAGVAPITFGASIWLTVLTVITVSAMYKLVMRWVIDGSGGSGLCEEEFGGWAVKVNGSITVIEYTLTFLVSVTALVTFLADRLPILNQVVLHEPLRVYFAMLCSLLIGFGVNLGPRISARIFGPATLGVLILLWVMILSTIWHLGLHFPSLHLAAFNLENIHFTLGGYARILALMTGIEVFANLVVAYSGSAKVRSSRAFGSLLIIMGTTSLTMLIVGPAIFRLSDPLNSHVSVFTQTMDKLLPMPLSYAGTFLGVMVLLSAGAASTQGLQNLALGLRYRHYIPAWFGALNRFEVAAKPVWVVILFSMICYLFFGTNEETYLALYAAGVFILLSLTSWAAVKRLFMRLKTKRQSGLLAFLIGASIAAVLTTLATIVIFEERFFSGAWFYFLTVPMFYGVFSYFRKQLGKPAVISERIGATLSSSTLPQYNSLYLYHAGVSFKNILVPLGQSPSSEYSLSCAQTIARNYLGTINLLTVLPEEHSGQMVKSAKEYLKDIKDDLDEAEYNTAIKIRYGDITQQISKVASNNIDLLIMTNPEHSLLKEWTESDTTHKVIHQKTPPLIIIKPTDQWRSIRTRFKNILVTLDGSQESEQILPYAKEIASKFGGRITLLSVSEPSDSDDVVNQLNAYLDKIVATFKGVPTPVKKLIVGHDPSQTILKVTDEDLIDLIMLASHGRGGVERVEAVKLGSVVEKILKGTPCPVFLVSAKE